MLFIASAYGIEQAFLKYGSRPQTGRETNWLDKSDMPIFVKFTRKLKVSLQWIYLYCIFIFRDIIVLYAVSCLLWCLPELSNE